MSVLQIPKSSGSVNSVNGQTGVISLSTNNIPESGNLYFTNSRAAGAITASSTSGHGLTYNSSTGTLTLSADYLNATPYTFVMRDSTGSTVLNSLTVQNVLSCLNVLYVPSIHVSTFDSAQLTLTRNDTFYVDAALFTIPFDFGNGNTTTVETSGFVYNIKPSTLSNLNSIVGEYGFKINNSTSTKQIKVKLGSNTLFSTGQLTSLSAASLCITARIVRLNSSAIGYNIKGVASNVNTTSFAACGSLSAIGNSFDTDNIQLFCTMQSTGSAAASNDIVGNFFTIGINTFGSGSYIPVM